MTASSFIAIDRTWTVQGPFEGVRYLVPDFLGKSLVASSGDRSTGHLRLHGGVRAAGAWRRFVPAPLIPKTGSVDLVPAGPEETRVRVRLEAEAGPADEERTRRALETVLTRLQDDLDALYGLVDSGLATSEAPSAVEAPTDMPAAAPAPVALGAVPCR